MKYLKGFNKLNETSIIRPNQPKDWWNKYKEEGDIDFIITKIKEKYPKEEVSDKNDLIDMICWFEDEYKSDIVDEDEVIHQLGIEYGL